MKPISKVKFMNVFKKVAEELDCNLLADRVTCFLLEMELKHGDQRYDNTEPLLNYYAQYMKPDRASYRSRWWGRSVGGQSLNPKDHYSDQAARLNAMLLMDNMVNSNLNREYKLFLSYFETYKNMKK